MWSSTISGTMDSGDTSSPTNNIAQYIEDYIDLVENSPNEIVRQVTLLHEHNHRYQQLLATLESMVDILTSTNGKCTSQSPSPNQSSNVTPTSTPNSSQPSTPAPASITTITTTPLTTLTSSTSSSTTTAATTTTTTTTSSSSSAPLPNENFNSAEKVNLHKRKCLLRVQRALIEIQEISDDKLFIIQSVLDQLDHKARQLDLDYRNVTMNANASNSYHSVSKNSNCNSNLTGGGDSDLLKEQTINSNSIHQQHGNDGNGNGKDTIVNSTAATAGNCNSNSPTHQQNNSSAHGKPRARRTINSSKGDGGGAASNSISNGGTSTNEYTGGRRSIKRANTKGNTKETKRKAKDLSGNNSPPTIYEDTPIDPDEPTYCLCKQVSFGEMIGCDNDACPIEWFHFSCVALSSKPKGRWYCPDCRGDRSNIPKK